MERVKLLITRLIYLELLQGFWKHQLYVGLGYNFAQEKNELFTI
ncbi:MAG: hypothetical protein ACLU4N_14245 [Butyricimonas faecihominis]